MGLQPVLTTQPKPAVADYRRRLRGLEGACHKGTRQTSKPNLQAQTHLSQTIELSPRPSFAMMPPRFQKEIEMKRRFPAVVGSVAVALAALLLSAGGARAEVKPVV